MYKFYRRRDSFVHKNTYNTSQQNFEEGLKLHEQQLKFKQDLMNPKFHHKGISISSQRANKPSKPALPRKKFEKPSSLTYNKFITIENTDH